MTDRAWGSPGSRSWGRGRDVGQERRKQAKLSLPAERRVRHPQAALGRAGAQDPGVGQDGAPENSREQASQVCFLFFVVSQALPLAGCCAGGRRHRRASKCRAPGCWQRGHCNLVGFSRS